MRKPLVCGNWKMNKTIEEARLFATEIVRLIKRPEGVDVVICPPYTALAQVAKIVDGTPVELGAQDIAWDTEGAYTGEISPLMLKEIGCSISIVGHSERRTLLGETDAIVNRKLKNTLKFNMTPILCVGEDIKEREAGRTESEIMRRLPGSRCGTRAEGSASGRIKS